ncbi:hypothetical protein DdX_11976 [Ditylenchus destructor]|uniref:Uncharacterized protein n=1 Tax=Ditylenchus destructor TaxID=166010 RepID=A0AAD4N1N7_9BILA|nr:hypothetical protein DdX_11976 [Ditylenchus destructor]
MLASADESVWRWRVIQSRAGGGAGEWNCSSPTKRPCALVATLCCIALIDSRTNRRLRRPSEARRAEVTGAGHTDTDEGILMAVREAPRMHANRFLARKGAAKRLPSSLVP